METRPADTHYGTLAAGVKDDNYNGVMISGAATGVAPIVAAIGDNTNVSLSLNPKGTAQLLSTTRLCETRAVATLTTAGVVTYSAAQMLGGLIKRDPNGAARSDVTETAANLAAAIPGVAAGASFEFQITNDADAAETITVTAGVGVTLVGTMTIAQNASRRFLVFFNSTSAVTIYSAGSFTT